jgi:hypothetical protein
MFATNDSASVGDANRSYHCWTRYKMKVLRVPGGSLASGSFVKKRASKLRNTARRSDGFGLVVFWLAVRTYR